MSGTVSVLDPRGFPPQVAGKALQPSLESLDGKTIALVDGRFDELVYPFLQQMQAWFAEHMPAVHTEIVRWREPFDDDAEASRQIAARADAAIFGVGV